MDQNKDEEWKLEIDYNDGEHWFYLQKGANDNEI